MTSGPIRYSPLQNMTQPAQGTSPSQLSHFKPNTQPHHSPNLQTNRPTTNPTPAPTPGPTRPTLNLRPFGQTRSENAFPYTNAASSSRVPNPSVASSSVQRRDSSYKRLSDEEYRSKIERGLCFRCDEKYTPGHRCQIGRAHV